MYLEIVQSTSQQEQVQDKSIITTLYDLHKNGNLDQNSIIEGWIRVSAAYEYMKTYLTAAFPNFRIDANSYYIKFIDPEIEKVFVASNYCTDGVGITQVDAARVTQIPQAMFKDNNNIRDFSDLDTILPYCTRISNNAFNSSSIETIDMSKIVTIEHNAFYNSALTGDLSIPNASGQLQSNTFRQTNITSISNLGSVSSIGDECFGRCSRLMTVTLPTNNIAIDNAFNGSSSINTISNIEYIVSLKGSAWNFTAMSSKVLNFKRLTTLYVSIFKSTTYKQIYLPGVQYGKNSKSGGYYHDNTYCAGLMCGSTVDLVYFKDLTSLYAGDFCNAKINALVIDSQNVVNLNNRNDLPDGDPGVVNNENSWNIVFTHFAGTIYVPDSLLSTYQSDSKWSQLNLNIRKISTLNNGTIYNTEEDWEAAGKPIALIREYM